MRRLLSIFLLRLTMLSFQYWIYLIPPGWLVRHIANPGSKGNILLGSKVISLLLGMCLRLVTFAIQKFWWYWLGLCRDSSLEFWFVLNFQLNITTSGLSGFPNIWSLTRTILNRGFNLDIGEQCFKLINVKVVFTIILSFCKSLLYFCKDFLHRLLVFHNHSKRL